jgi:hypothetical protein
MYMRKTGLTITIGVTTRLLMVSTLLGSPILPHLPQCLTCQGEVLVPIRCNHNPLTLPLTPVQARRTLRDSHPCRHKGHIARYHHRRQSITHHLPPDLLLRIHLT